MIAQGYDRNAKTQWGNSFLAKRTAKVIVKIGIVVPMTVGGMDAVVEPTGILLIK
ncbi:hypothetical protein L5M28_03045 [Shewanella sp. SW32]|uniref:hypothetical protein n=1 Tax=Shewanella TaxID=22 RepID=UPI0021D95240|nr:MULTISPECIES: hypothetical protein [unclassified Shewanella]MCU7961552.1 hypothetical protein [Shewanella sp. SW32]MCU7969634.1 hypothetical protein [Shewanella sp. SW29]